MPAFGAADLLGGVGTAQPGVTEGIGLGNAEVQIGEPGVLDDARGHLEVEANPASVPATSVNWACAWPAVAWTSRG